MIIVFKENSTIVLEALPIHIKIFLMLGLILVINNTETVKKILVINKLPAKFKKKSLYKHTFKVLKLALWTFKCFYLTINYN